MAQHLSDHYPLKPLPRHPLGFTTPKHIQDTSQNGFIPSWFLTHHPRKTVPNWWIFFCKIHFPKHGELPFISFFEWSRAHHFFCVDTKRLKRSKLNVQILHWSWPHFGQCTPPFSQGKIWFQGQGSRRLCYTSRFCTHLLCSPVFTHCGVRNWCHAQAY